MLAKHSLESQAHQILMFQASVTFFLAVNLQRHRKPMRVQLQSPLWMRKLIASENSRKDRWIPAMLLHRHDLDGISALVVPIRRLTQHQLRGHES